MARRTLGSLVMYDGLFTFGLRLLNIACAAALGILTARLLGPAGKGLYVLPSVEAALVATTFGGLNSATSYFLLHRRLGPRYLRTIALAGFFYIALGTLLLVPIALITRQSWTLLPAILSLPASAAVNLAAGYALGVKRVRFSTAVNVVVTALTLLMMGGAFLALGASPSVAIAVWIAASSMVGLVAIVAVALHTRALAGDEHVGVAQYMRFSFKVASVNVVTLLNYRADLYIVALLASTATLGMYTVAVSAAESLLVPTQISALVTSPHIAGMELRAAGLLTARCVRNNLMIAALICGALFALAAPIVRALYGAPFVPLVPGLRILLLGVLALSLGSPISSYFTLRRGRPEVALWLASTSAVICIALALVFVPRLGMVGAAIGSTAGYTVGQAIALWYFSREARVPLRALLVPTPADLHTYSQFATRLLQDGRRIFRPTMSTPQ